MCRRVPRCFVRRRHLLDLLAQPVQNQQQADGVVEGVSVVLLAGGVGKRMKADRPKQFLELLGKPVLLHSLEIFSTLPGVDR